MGLATVGDNLNYNIDRGTGEVIETHNDIIYEQRERDLQAAEKAEQEKWEREKQSPYKDFTQFNLEHTEDWIALNKKSHIATEILMFLMKNSDRYNALVCSVNVLSEALGYGRTSISNAIKILKNSGFVDIKKSGNTNVFLINKEIAWKSWGKNYRYATFGAKIIISESEQEKAAVKNTRMNVAEIKIPRGSAEGA